MFKVKLKGPHFRDRANPPAQPNRNTYLVNQTGKHCGLTFVLHKEYG